MIIAKYTCNASGVVPTFNDGYIYEINETENTGVYTVEITSENDFSSCSFNGKSQLLTVEYLKVTSKVTNMRNMLQGCTNLTSLDLTNFDTSSVTNMSGVFYNCNKLTSLDLSNFNTNKVTDMSSMFYNCNKLTSLDLSNFDTSNATNMYSMFYNCTKLTSLDISNFNTSNVTNMGGMFAYCQLLTSLDLSNFNTSKVTNMSYMFYDCKKLTLLDLSNFNTSKVTNMASMFSDCHNLLSLDISNWSTDGTSGINGMLNNCRALRKVNLSNSSPATVSTIVSLLPNRSADNKCYIFARVEVPNQKYWETILCKDSYVTVSLPQPLNKIGDVKDKLYWDEDKGHYCIEQNIYKHEVTEVDSWNLALYSSTRPNKYIYHIQSSIEDYNKLKTGVNTEIYIASNKFTNVPPYYGGKYAQDIDGVEYISKSLIWTDRYGLMWAINSSKLEGSNANYAKNYLKSKLPFDMYFVLETPNIIDLPHLNEKYSLDTYMPTTYLECSNSPIQPSRMYFETDKLKYKPLALETNKDYTIQFECIENSDTKVKVVLGGVEEEIEAVVGTNHINITTPAELSSDRLYISGQGNKVSEVMLIGGDMKQYPNYFDGVQGVGVLQDDNTYKIDIKTNEDFIVSIKTDLPLSKEDRLYWNDTNKRYEIDRSGEIEIPTVEGDVIDLPRLYQREDTVLTVEYGNIKPSEIKIEYKNLN